jgi:hypothetical protein
MSLSQAEIYELIARGKAAKTPLQCHYFRSADPTHVPRGFITAVSPDAFGFIPLWSGITERFIFHYAAGDGEYSEPKREVTSFGESTLRSSRGGVLTLRALDGTLMFMNSIANNPAPSDGLSSNTVSNPG